MIKNGQKYLINTDNWFVAPDGEQYKAVWGTCYLRQTEEVFGFTPARPSTNWFLEIGKDGKEIIVAGCQVHYAIRCEERPKDVHFGKYYVNKDTEVLLHESKIYYAE